MRLTIRTDGGARGNPGPAAAGIVIKDPQSQQTLLARGYFLGKTTNNVAEYEGVLKGLEEAQKLGGTNLQIFCDSELVVRQLNGQYKVKKAHLLNYYENIKTLISQFDKVTISHVPRSQNAHADALVNQALDKQSDV
jgi:ribonuclease HI